MRQLVSSTSFPYFMNFVCVLLMTGLYNPDGKSCSIIAVLALLQYLKPLMELVASRKGALCQKLHEVKKTYYAS